MFLTPYKRRFNQSIKEAFLKGQVERAIIIALKILKQRYNIHMLLSQLPISTVKVDGRKLSGINAYTLNGKRIRFNWFTKDTSSTIISLDIWDSVRLNPDREIDLTIYPNFIQMLPVIAKAILEDGFVGEIPMEISEDAPALDAKTGGKVSKETARSITAWSEETGVDEDKLTNTRLADLYKEYSYWIEEVATDETIRVVPWPTFRLYLLSYMEKYSIQNIFMRNVKVVTGTKEKVIVTDEVEEKKFNSFIYQLSLEDTFGLIKSRIRSIIQNYMIAFIVVGRAGLGKTDIVSKTLGEEAKGFKIKYIKGGISRPFDLYKILYDNNSSKTIIVFDDTDEMISTKYKQFSGIVKAMLDPNMRIISYSSDKTGEDTGKRTDEFLLKSRIIIVSNLHKDKLPEPVYSRGNVASISATPQQILDYIEQNLNNILPEYKSITIEMKKDTLDFLRSYSKELARMDFRIFQNILKDRATDPENKNWKRWAMLSVTKMKH
jgi:hypothetical protein